MFNIGPLELMVILIVALVVVGPKRLPEVGRTIGKSLREFRKATDEVKSSFDFNLDDDFEPDPPTPAKHVETLPDADEYPARHVETIPEAGEVPTERFEGFEESDGPPALPNGHATPGASHEAAPPEPPAHEVTEHEVTEEEPEYRRPSASATEELPDAPIPPAQPPEPE